MSHILIAGAGPVGLTMAAELARYGIPVRIIDRAPQPTQTSKALVLWSRTLELMDRMGCTPGFLQAGLRARGATLRGGGAILVHTGFGDVPSPYNFALMLPQRDTERLLAEHLQTFGVTVERRVELLGFHEGADGIEARLGHEDGREEILVTPWLIGCDGAHSTVRHGLGIGFGGSTQADDWVLADVRLEGDDMPPGDEIATYLHRDGPFVIFPIPGGRARVIAAVGKADPARPEPTLASVQALAEQRTGCRFRLTDPVWLANFHINERKVSEYGRGRALLAGDAAHVHSPAGGQGMNTGMQDAINLAWKLALVVRGEAAPSLLQSYTPERSAVGDMVLRNATRMTDLATLANPAAQAARNLALRVFFGFHAAQNRMAVTMSEIEIAYAKSPLSVGRGAGARLPPDQYGGAPPGSGSMPRFTLYTADASRGQALARRFPALLEAEPRPPADPQTLLIVRPDGYVGLSAHADGWAEAAAYLGSFAATGSS